MIELPQPYLIFLGDLRDKPSAKTAYGVRDWSPGACIGQWSLPECQIDLGLARMTPVRAHSEGARALLIGAAPFGGGLPENWISAILEALQAGLDIVSGLHTALSSVNEIATAAARCGRTLYDVRHSDYERSIASGRKRTGNRLLTVGTDCSVGKKYTALGITRAMQKKGRSATFRATGQTGIMISGAGIAIDAVISDFVAGAAERLSPDSPPDHWDIIEGQGSLFHPAYAGVTLGLLHGSQPDALVLCHDPSRYHMANYPNYRLPSLCEALDIYLRHGRLTNPRARFVGVSINTAALDAAEGAAALRNAEAETKLPAVDVLKNDLSPILELMDGASC
jgi:uncharacterized NAD-dependent epimerase/dehydratase family protein